MTTTVATSGQTPRRDAPGGGRWRTWVAVEAPAAAPTFDVVPTGGPDGETAHAIRLADDPASFGKWISPAVRVRGGAYYRVRLWQRTEGVPHPEFSAPAMVTWRGAVAPPWSRPWTAHIDRGREASPDAPLVIDRQYMRRTAEGDGAWRLLELAVRAPEEAVEVEVEGWLRHTPSARTWYAPPRIEEVAAPATRVVTLATVRATPPAGSTLDDNRALLARLIEGAADAGADVVCLPENALITGTGLLSVEAAERLDGPTVAVLSRVAAARRIHVVAQFPERDARYPHRLYNTAVLLDRAGGVAGVFHKMHLTTGEWERGMIPGDGPVVVETEIGRLGMLVCFDLHFPEAVRQTALAGAEVVFGPTVGDRWPERREHVTRAHAVANGVCVVTSLVSHPSDIIDPLGRLVARAAEPNSIAVATVDLDFKASPEGRAIGPDNGTSPNSYWPARRRDLYGDW